jgi:hypothetical protein
MLPWPGQHDRQAELRRGRARRDGPARIRIDREGARDQLDRALVEEHVHRGRDGVEERERVPLAGAAVTFLYSSLRARAARARNDRRRDANRARAARASDDLDDAERLELAGVALSKRDGPSWWPEAVKASPTLTVPELTAIEISCVRLSMLVGLPSVSSVEATGV